MTDRAASDDRVVIALLNLLARCGGSVTLSLGPVTTERGAPKRFAVDTGLATTWTYMERIMTSDLALLMLFDQAAKDHAMVRAVQPEDHDDD